MCRGGAALAVIAGATAAALEAQRRRKEEEARQAAKAAQEAARKNAAFEAERVQNYLQGQAMLEAALQNASLSEAERQAVQEQAKSKGLGAALGLKVCAKAPKPPSSARHGRRICWTRR